MAQYVLINTIGTRRAGEVIDTVQDPGVVPQLAAFGGVLVLLPSPTLQPYIEAAQLAYDRADADEAQDIMMAGYASTTAIAGGGTAGFVPIWTAGAVLGDSVIKQSGSLVGINVAAPTAALSLPSGVAGAASMNFGTGVAPGAPNSGDLWFDGTYLYLRAAGVNQPLNAPFGTGTPNVLTKWSSVSGLTDTAITEASGAIRTIGITNAGAGATNGTYSQQTLTNITGTGTGATADIVVSGNVVTVLTLRSPGTGYAPGDTLSCATIGGGGFVFTVSAVSASDNASGNVTAVRVGAGTTNPSMTIYAAGAIGASKFERRYFTDVIVNTLGTRAGTVLQINDTQSESTGVFLAQATLDPTIYGSITIPRVDFSAISVTTFGYGSYSRFICENPTSAGTTALVGGGFDVIMNTAAVGKTIALRGVFANVTLGNLGAGNTISFMRSVDAQSFISTTATQTITDHSMIDCTHSTNTATIQNTTNFYAFRSRAHTWTGAAHTVTNFYGVLLLAPSLSNGSTITNRWSGISHEDALGKSRFYGNVGVGNALDVGAGKVIGSLTLTNAGAGATNGTYIEAALTGGSGTGATADIVVAGNVVTTLLLRNPGQGYVVGDTLSTAAIGGAGFVFTVASTASILRSDGTAVAARVGAGTTSPRLSLDAVNGAMITGSASMIETNYYTSYFNSNIGAFVGGTVTPSTIYRGVFVNPLINTTSMAFTTAAGLISNPNFTDSTAGSITNLTGLSSLMYRSYPNDLSTGANLTGVQSILGTRAGVGSVTSGSFTFFTGNLFHTVAGHTITTLTWYDTAATTLTGNATTTYLLRGRAFSGAGTITNRWAISQEDPLAKSAFYGNVGVGNALDVGAGKVIASLTLTNAGTGYTNGTYAQVALTTSTGSGSGATADIVVAGGIVTTVVLRNPGQGYAVGDTLSCASIGAGSNFLLTVATTASILRSDGTVVAPRVGAGTTAPVTTAHVNGALSVTRVEPRALRFAVGTGYCQANVFVDSSGYAADQIPADAANQSQYGVLVVPHYDFSTRATTSLLSAIAVQPFIDVATTAGTTACYGYESYPTVWTTSITGRTISLRAYAGGPTAGALGAGNTLSSFDGVNLTSVLSAANATTVTNARGFNYQLLASGAAHAITSAYGVRLLAASLSGGATITNNWGVSQEDTTSKNQFLGNVGVGIDPGAGKMIASLTLTNGGAGYTNGTYSQVALTNITGTGTGATADIVVAGGIVTTVVLRSPGQGYVVGNTLSSASIGAGAGFVLTVATVASTIQADGEIIAPRIGAGTTTPRAEIDIPNGLVYATGAGNIAAISTPLSTSPFAVKAAFFSAGSIAFSSLNETTSSYYANNWFDATAVATGTAVATSFRGSNRWSATNAGQSTLLNGVSVSANRSEAADLATSAQVIGCQANAAVSTGCGSASTTSLIAFNSICQNGLAGHTVSTGYCFNGQTSITGTFTTLAVFRQAPVGQTGTITTFYGLRLEATTAPTITNRYPIAQEDTLGTNFVRAKTHFGAAVGTAAATTASIEVTAQGTLNGDIRLNSANAVVDVSAASTNGVKFNNRGGAGITGTTQFWYEEGTYTPTLSAGWTATAGNYAGYWTRNGRLVTLTIQFTGGTNSGAAGGSTISTPVGLTPARNGAGSAVNANGTALGNGVVVVTTAGTIINANAITTTTVDKTIVVQYEV